MADLPDDAPDRMMDFDSSIEHKIHRPDGPQQLTDNEKMQQELHYLRMRHAKRDLIQGAIDDNELEEYMNQLDEVDYENFKYSEEGDAFLKQKLYEEGMKIQEEGKDRTTSVDVYEANYKARLQREQQILEDDE